MYSEKLQILEELFGNFYCLKNEHLFFCPFCKHHKRKLSINLHSNAYKCWVCESSGRDIYWLIRKFGDHEQKKQWRSFDDTTVELSEFENVFDNKVLIREQEQRIVLPKEYICLARNDLSIDANLALKYLKKRNVTKLDILKWKIGYCSDGKYKHCIIVPSFNNNGHSNYFIARTYSKKELMKYKNPPISKNKIVFNELMIDWREPIILVEGIFDALKADNSIPLLGSALSESSKLFATLLEKTKTIYLALDRDAEKKLFKIAHLLMSYGIKIYKIKVEDYTDVGEMTKEEFEKRKQSAVLLDETTFLMQKILQI